MKAMTQISPLPICKSHRLILSSMVRIVLGAMVLLLIPITAYGQSSLGNLFNKKNDFIAPDHLFYVVLPNAWIVQRTDTYRYLFTHPRYPGSTLTLTRHETEPTTTSRHLLDHAMTERMMKLPAAKMHGQKIFFMGGLEAAMGSVIYWFQGNAQVIRVQEELHLAAGNEAFVFQFEGPVQHATRLSHDLSRMYGSFVPRPGMDRTELLKPRALPDMPFGIGKEKVVPLKPRLEHKDGPQGQIPLRPLPSKKEKKSKKRPKTKKRQVL